MLKKLLIAAIIFVASPALVSAQVNGSGTSDSALFDTVINVPEDMPSINGSIGSGPFSPSIQLNVSDGGTVAEGFRAEANVEVNISGGTVGSGFSINGFPDNFGPSGVPSELNISGGNFATGFSSFQSQVRISGGVIGGFSALESSVVISGGSIGAGIDLAFSSLFLSGSEFLLDGEPIDGLVDGESFRVNNREATLSAVLEDGATYSIDLSSYLIFDSTIFVTRVAAIPEVILGDVNMDGDVNFSDIERFIELLSSGEFQLEADINLDGEVNFEDVAPFVEILVDQ